MFYHAQLRRRRAQLLASVAVLSGLAPGPALAATQIEEIFVTATKRTTELQLTPIAVTALSGEFLQATGAVDFQDYFRRVPGLAVLDNGAGRKRYLLRGVSSIAPMGAQATVAQYLDEVPLTDNFDQQPDPHLTDIERVEVLRGPQGTLFGARAVSGTIRTITRKPVIGRVEGNVGVTVSNTRMGGTNANLEGVVNVPVSETMAMRLSGFYFYNDGYVDNVFAGGVIRITPQQLPAGVPVPPPVTVAGFSQPNYSDVKYYGGRGSLRWQPSERMTVDFMVLGQQGKVGGVPVYDVGLTGNETNGLKTSILAGSGNEDQLVIGSGTLVYGFDWADLTANASYAKRNNFSSSGATLVGPGPAGTGAFGSNTKSWTFEARLASNTESRWQWLVGGYAFDQDRDSRMSQNIGLGSYTLFDVLAESRTNEYAGFGELAYKPIDKVSLTAGVRYSKYRNHLHQTYIVTPPNGLRRPDIRFNEGSTTLKFEISYTASREFMTYAVASQGFRPGGFNPNAAPGFNVVPEFYKSDSLWNYEIGAKTSWLDRRLTVNGALYMIDWSNMQVQGFAPSPIPTAMAIVFTSNASSSRIVGLEMEASAHVTDRFTVDFSFNHFFKNNLTKDPPPNPNGLAAKTGDPLSYNPETSFNIGAEYRAPLTDRVNGFARIDWSYTGRRFTGFRPFLVNGARNSIYNNLPPYHLVNLRFGLNQEQWRFSVFIENLFDGRTIMQQQNLVGASPATLRVTSRPRTFGATINRNF